jgi:hypothetical protein
MKPWEKIKNAFSINKTADTDPNEVKLSGIELIKAEFSEFDFLEISSPDFDQRVKAKFESRVKVEFDQRVNEEIKKSANEQFMNKLAKPEEIKRPGSGYGEDGWMM